MQLVFGEESASFKKSVVWMVIMILIGTLFGIMFEVMKLIRARMKVSEERE